MQSRTLVAAMIGLAVLGMAVLAPGVQAEKKPKKKAACMYTCPEHQSAKATWKAKCPKCATKMCPMKKKDKKKSKAGKAASMCASCPIKKDVVHLKKKMAHLGKKVKRLHHKLKGMHKQMAARKKRKKAKKPGMKDKMKKMMKKMKKKMSPAQELRHKILVKSKIKAVDPQALLALKDKLHLKDKQIMRLRVILETTRDMARETLNKKQQKKLKKLHGTPKSMMGMHKKMMKKMKK